MNATAIVKIVRGRKRCRLAVRADSASESPRGGAQITEQSDRRGIWFTGGDRLRMTGAHCDGLVADAASMTSSAR